jgi:hypothetical protein
MNVDTGQLKHFAEDQDIPDGFVRLLKEEEARLKKEQIQALEKGDSLYLPENDKLRRHITIRDHVDRKYSHLNRKQKREKISAIKKEMKGGKINE